MKIKWKSVMAFVLALSMIQSPVSVNAMTAKAAVQPKMQTETSKKVTKDKTEYAEGEAIILYNNNSAATIRIRTGNKLDKDMAIKETYSFDETKKAAAQSINADETGISVSLVKSEKYSTKELLGILRKRSDIKYAAPNYRVKATAMKDPYKQYQWALNNDGQNGGTEGFDVNSDAEEMQNIINTDEKVVAIVDSGVNYEHEDLKNVMWNNPFNSKKLKGQHGYDFVNYDEDPLDDNGHGSHCAGIIAAESGNETGVSGIANDSNIKIMALKFLDEDGYGYGMDDIAAYNYIYKAQKLGVNIVAINNSWGATIYDVDEASEGLELYAEIYNMVGEAGAVSVCAAGNEAVDNEEVYSLPANIDSPYIISVAASNGNDELAGFSNYGNNVDIAAPGTEILSTVAYNVFNPILYADKDYFCSIYNDFENITPVEITKEDFLAGKNAQAGDINYMLEADRDADMNVSIEDGVYFGKSSEGTKSLKWTITGAEQGGVYNLYLPYEAEASDTSLYSSVSVKVSGPEGYYDELWGYEPSILFALDSVFDKHGNYDEENERIIGGTYIDEGNYWTFCSGEAAYGMDKAQQRVMKLQIMASADGDFTVYADNFAVSRAGVEADEFGQYDFYNGTSMATPYVTGAVASIANSFADENAIERKARILGSVRKSDALSGKVNTGGVLDLSKAGSPVMYIDNVSLNEKEQIEIKGYYFKGCKVKLNGNDVTPIEINDKGILIDGTSYINRYVTIELEKGEDVLTKQCLLANGEKFTAEGQVDGMLNGGTVVSSGESIYYIDDIGFVSIGTPIEEYPDDDDDFYYMDNYEGNDEMPTTEEEPGLDWVEQLNPYYPELFGEEYKYTVDGILTNISEFAFLNKTLYTELYLNVGFAEERILVYYDEEEGWKKYTDIPDEFSDVIGSTLTAYDGKLYLIGGVDIETGICSDKVCYYNESTKKWVNAPSLPETRCCSKAMQVGKKLVLTLGGNGKDSDVENLIYDGSKWTASKAEIELIADEESFFYTVDGEAFPIYTAQTGLIKDGIIYTDAMADGLGDTFVYNLITDKFTASGYSLNRETLAGDTLFATTAQDKLYAIYGTRTVMFEDDDEYYSNKKSIKSYEDDSDFDFDDEFTINVCSIPIKSGFIHVEDSSEFMAYVEGAGYYLPGDTIKLTPKTFDNYYISSFVVNGKKISPDKNGKYSYTAKADSNAAAIKVKAEAGAYVSDIFLSNDIITLEKSNDAKKNSCYIYADIYPGDAANTNIIWTTSNANVATVDRYGKVTVAKNAKVNQTAVIRATAEDRKTVYAECTVIIAKETIRKNSKHRIGNFTYIVTQFSSNKKTVTCIGMNKKNASKAAIPSTVKIGSYRFKVTGIGTNAFKNCKKLKKVTIGKNVAKIGKNAFKGCKKLTSVTIKALHIKSFGKGMFSGTSKKLSVKVPKKVKKSYSAKLKKAGFKGKVVVK